MAVSFMTVAELRDRLDPLPHDAKLFVYVGSRVTFVQAEWSDPDAMLGGMARVLEAEVDLGGGGPVRGAEAGSLRDA